MAPGRAATDFVAVLLCIAASCSCSAEPAAVAQLAAQGSLLITLKTDDRDAAAAPALNQSQLFLDGSLLRLSRGLSVRMHTPKVDSEPVITQEHAWEGTMLNAYNSLVELPNGTIYLYCEWHPVWVDPQSPYRLDPTSRTRVL